MIQLNLKKRRGVSQIVGSLVVLGMVSSIGSVILFHGMDEINAFSYDLSFHEKSKNEAYREDVIFEHIRFEPNSDNISIYLSNTGSVESVIDTISVVKVDTQEILVNWQNINSNLLLKDTGIIDVSANLSQGLNTWNDPYYLNSEYKISLTTSRGNFFATVASPFNT